MAIAAVSNIHGNLGALEAVLGDIGRRGVDVAVNLRDMTLDAAKPGDPTFLWIPSRRWRSPRT